MAQIGGPDDEEKQFASLLPGQSIETLTLEEALELFKLPRNVGRSRRQKSDGGHWSVWTLCAGTTANLFR